MIIKGCWPRVPRHYSYFVSSNIGRMEGRTDDTHYYCPLFNKASGDKKNIFIESVYYKIYNKYLLTLLVLFFTINKILPKIIKYIYIKVFCSNMKNNEIKLKSFIICADNINLQHHMSWFFLCVLRFEAQGGCSFC